MLSIKTFLKLIEIEIPNRLQILQYSGIRRDRQIVVIINNSGITIIHIGK